MLNLRLTETKVTSRIAIIDTIFALESNGESKNTKGPSFETYCETLF